MNKRIPLGAAIAFIFIVAAATFSMTMIYSQSLFNERVNYLKERGDIYEKFTEIDRNVRRSYYGTLNEKNLMDSMARGYIAGIGDPYAQYLTVEEYAKRTQNIEGGNVGIGAVLALSPDGYLAVREVYPDSPAQNVGLVEGDHIIKIGETGLTIENSEEQLEAIGGAAGTKLTLTVRRGAEEHTVEITRREVVIPTVYAQLLPDTDIGYIIITKFDDNTSNQFNRELNRLQNLGCNSIIFDLRDNTGGVLRSATRILDRLVPAGPLVSVTYKDGSVQVLETSDANEIVLPIITLTNKGTASVSELFVQVLRDYGKGRSVGSVTAGRGVAQELIKLTDGSAFDLTVARYNSPTGETFDKVGIKPDFDVQLPAELGDWRELDSLSDPQLKKAIEIALSLENVAKNAANSSPEPDASSQDSSAQPATPESASQTPSAVVAAQ